MALAEVGARLRLQGAQAYRRDAERAAGATDRLGREMGQLDRASGQARRGLAGVGKGMSGLARTAGGLPGILGAAAGGGLAVFGLSLLDTATKIEGLGNKAKVVFGSELASVQRWAAGAAEAMGLSSSEAVGLSAGLADLLVPIGFTRKAAAKMSTDLVGLSGALSQWSGGQYDAASVAEILQGAMLGETDALQSLGIAISAADVEAALLAKGQSKLTGNAKKQAEAQAIIGLVYEKSTDAQKAYKDGANSLGVSQARLSSKVKTLRERFATKLTPFFIEALEWVEKRMPGIETRLDGFATSISDAIKPGSDFRTTMADLWPTLKDVAKFAGDVLEKMRDLVGWMIKHETAVKTFAGALLGYSLAVKAIAVWGAAATAIGWIGLATGITAVGAGGATGAVGLTAFGTSLKALVAVGGPVAAAIVALGTLAYLLKATSDIGSGGTPDRPGYGESYTDPKTGNPIGLPPLTPATRPNPNAPRPSKGGVPYKPPYVYVPPRRPVASDTASLSGKSMSAPINLTNTIMLDGKVVAQSTKRVLQDEAARR